MKETKCSNCPARVLATDDDFTPLCEDCQAAKMEDDMHRAIMAGEFDHIDLDDWIAMMGSEPSVA